MPTLPFTQLDVFASGPLSGNPLAVVHGADALTDEQLRGFARWTGLSETTFLLAPTDPAADYRVRIFTPGRELPFAGHPTLGSAAAWLGAGGRGQQPGRVVQQCAGGLVPVRVAGDRLAFAAPPLVRDEPLDEPLLARITAALGLQPADVLDARWLVNGPEWVGLRLADADRVLAVELDPAGLEGLDLGLVGPHPPGGEVQLEVRALLVGDVPGQPVAEDPVTGSLNAGLAQWLIRTGAVPARYVAAQGQRLGAAGRVHVEQTGGTTWVGGQVRWVVTGSVDL